MDKSVFLTFKTGGFKMEPRFFTKPAFHIIGYELKTKTVDGQNNKDIPEFWEQFLQQNLGANIPSPIRPNEEYGICTDFCPETGEFSYIIGKEVKEGTTTSEGMVYKSFPEEHYAVFTTPEATEATFSPTIQSSWNYIFSEWFPKSDYKHAETTEFELYDERCFGAKKVMDIYIPVQKKDVTV